MSNGESKAEGLDSQEVFLEFFKLPQCREQLGQLSVDGKTSITIDFEDLVAHKQDLAKHLMEKPVEFLAHAQHAALEQLRIEDPEYAEKIKEVTVRIHDLYDVTPLRKLGAPHINKLVMINGVAVKTTIIHPKVLKAAFECRRCGERQFMEQKTPFLKIPVICTNPSCQKKGPFDFMEEESEYTNIQEFWIQEGPEEMPAGQLPRNLHIKASGEIVDVARPGDDVSVVGIVRALPRKVKGGSLSTFDIYIEANSIKVLGKEPEAIPDLAEVNRIRELAHDPWIHRKIITSIAPSIYGYENIKEAIVYLLFGGVPKEKEDIKIRGEINILLVGDPGTAKSQLLRFVAQKIAPRGLYTSGKGTSGVGLTAAVLKDESGQFMLEAGALVLADKGIACIDGSTRILLDGRIISVKELWEMGKQTGNPLKRFLYLMVPSWHTQLKRMDYQMLYEVIRKPYKGKLLTIQLSNGLSIKVTPDHLFYYGVTHKGLKPASQLKKGHILKIPELPRPLHIVDVSSNKAYLYGMIYGDGYVSSSGVTISQSMKNKDIIQKLEQIFPQGKLYVKKPKKRMVNNYMLTSHDAQFWFKNDRIICDYMQHFAKLESLLCLEEEALKSFIGGLFDADGSINHLQGKVIALRLFATSDPTQAEILIYALKRLGINSKKQNYRRDALIELSITGANINAFWDNILPYSVKLQREKQPIILHKKYYKQYSNQWSVVTNIQSEDYEGYVFDVNVYNTHNFIAEGVLIHNCIDELDKMREEDRVTIHETLEQHTVSIAKGGIVATLNARTAVLAAANPALGRYNAYQSIVENMALPVTLLSRFDLIFLMTDVPDIEKDTKLSEHILKIHSGTDNPAPIPPSLLKKYIAFARKEVHPKLTKEAIERIQEFYLKMRKASAIEGAPIAIGPRQLEGLTRIAEARARATLRQQVTAEDAEAAIRMMMQSLQEVGIDLSTGKPDIDIIMTGKPKSLRDKTGAIIKLLVELERETLLVEEELLIKQLGDTYGIQESDSHRLIQQLLREGVIFQPKEGYLRKT
jgi:replicative DNA helicase Mcm